MGFVTVTRNESCCHIEIKETGFTVCVSNSLRCSCDVQLVLLTSLRDTGSGNDLYGAKVGITYPLWMSWDNRPTTDDEEQVHVFMSYGEFWHLPDAWTVCPVSSGYGLGCCSWLFQNGSTTFLVAELGLVSTTTDQCMFPPISSGTPIEYFALFGSPKNESIIDLESVKSKILTVPSPLNITMSSLVELTAMVVQLVHHIAPLEKPVVVYGGKLINQLKLLASMYDWLHRDMQIYLRKCVRYASDENCRVDDPILLLDLIRSNRVVLIEKGTIDEGKVAAVFSSSYEPYLSETMLSVAGSRLIRSASLDEVVALYKPGKLISSQSETFETSGLIESYVRSEEDLTRVLKIRFDDVVIESSDSEMLVDVKSIGVRATFGGTKSDRLLASVDAYDANVSDSVLAQFIHLVR
jgi:hypothetical protein